MLIDGREDDAPLLLGSLDLGLLLLLLLLELFVRDELVLADFSWHFVTNANKTVPINIITRQMQII